MPQEMSPETLLPPFLKYGTLPKMSAMARKLALARKAIKEIVKIDDVLGAESYVGEVPVVDKDLAMRETVKFALIAINAVRNARGILEGVKADVESYRGEL
jgi:phosphopantetheine adenylyltransferase